jgi:hypothetical protein
VKNQAAVALGKMGKGIPKDCSPAERKRRRLVMENLNVQRARRNAKAAPRKKR